MAENVTTFRHHSIFRAALHPDFSAVVKSKNLGAAKQHANMIYKYMTLLYYVWGGRKGCRATTLCRLHHLKTGLALNLYMGPMGQTSTWLYERSQKCTFYLCPNISPVFGPQFSEVPAVGGIVCRCPCSDSTPSRSYMCGAVT